MEPSPPSAVCVIEIASSELRAATPRPAICADMRTEMAKPAASSRAELTRRPDARR